MEATLRSGQVPLAPEVPKSIVKLEAPSSSWTFTQGLILGQASFLVLTLIFVRYVVFSPANKRDGEDWKKRRDERVKVSYGADEGKWWRTSWDASG
jgi:hypothetical protein